MTKLTEGMRGGDLEDLILPMLSVDEFEAKASEDAMVFAFFVNDKEAAMDLNRFIQKSPLKLVDTEVSPAPDQRGYYVLFIELMRNARLSETIEELFEEIKPLVLIEKWKLQIRGKDDLVPFSRKALDEYLRELKKKEKEIKDKKQAKADAKVKAKKEPSLVEKALRFLTPSGLSRLEAKGRTLYLEGMGVSGRFDVVAFDEEAVIASTLAESPIDMSLTDAAKEVRMSRMLGEGWSVARVAGMNVLSHEMSDMVLLLRDR